MNQSALAWAFGLLLSAPCVEEKEKPTTDLKRFEGSWLLIAAEENGKQVAPKDVMHKRAVFRGDRILEAPILIAGEPTFRLDPSKQPKHIDIQERIDDEIRTIHGIYVLEEDELKICYHALTNAGERKRPSEFKTKPKSYEALLVFRREK